MRHKSKKNSLGRKSSHRKAMMENLATSLILHKRIKTTVAKAKELKKYVEPIITRSKEDNTHNRRICFSMLSDKKAVAELFREISPKIADRPGGYTRILKTDFRAGDNAEMCIIELVDYNQVMLGAKEDKAAKTTRRRRSTTKKKPAATSETAETTETTTEKEEKTEKAEKPAPKAKKASKPKTEKPAGKKGNSEKKEE